MSVGFVYDPLYLEHDTGEHPENGRRVTATMELLQASGLLEQLARIEARDATPDELALVHDARYIAAIRHVADEGGGWVDPDTLITPRSYDVAVRVVGSTLAAADAMMRGDATSAFCLVRPPGHHATPVQAMGFCLFNHVAIAARYLRERHGLARVAIVDFDVHHGNGTQDAFYGDASVLYVSTHEYPFYPGTGAAEEVGEGAGSGYNVNIPMPHHCGDREYARAFEEVVAPVVRRFRPDAILVSAGYDAHFADEIAYERLSVDGYGAIGGAINALAAELCRGRVLYALEGGYHLTALPWSVRRTLELLLGRDGTPDPVGLAPAAPEPDGFDAALESVKRLHGL